MSKFEYIACMNLREKLRDRINGNYIYKYKRK